MGTVLAGLRTRLGAFTPKQLVAAGLLVAVVLGTSVGLVRWLTAPTYDVLFSGLSATDAAAVVDAVEATGTAYKLTEDGATSTVLVPVKDAARLRLSLAAEDLPGDSVVGYELLDAQGVTVSTFREQVNYQRALEGELVRTLMTLEAVRSASVHIVLPQDRLYTEDQTPATASVTLTTSGVLDDDQVASITHLVSSSVPGLAPAQVTVTDSSGTLLSKSGGGVGGGDEQDIEAEYASRLETRATSMLDSVVGAGKAVVRVQADLDFTERTRQSETFDPDQVAANSASREQERYTSTEPLPQGQLTADPDENVPPLEATSNYERSAEDEDFSVSREIVSEKENPGAVDRMTVSVLLDPVAAADADVAQIQSLVENAVGFDEARGDRIAVEYIAFAAADDEPYTDPAIAAAAAAERTKLIVGAAVAGVLLVAVVILGLVLLRGRKKAAPAPAPDPDLTTVLPPVAGGPLPGTVDPAAQLSVPSRSGGEADRLLEKVADRPDDAAKVLRGLMASDQVGDRR